MDLAAAGLEDGGETTAVVERPAQSPDAAGGAGNADSSSSSGENGAPTASADTAAIDADGELERPAPGVLANDTDPDGDELRVTAVEGGSERVGEEVTLDSGAQVEVGEEGGFAYEAHGAFADLNAGETTTDSFGYTVADGNGASATASVTITVAGVSEDDNAEEGGKAGDSGDADNGEETGEPNGGDNGEAGDSKQDENAGGDAGKPETGESEDEGEKSGSDDGASGFQVDSLDGNPQGFHVKLTGEPDLSTVSVSTEDPTVTLTGPDGERVAGSLVTPSSASGLLRFMAENRLPGGSYTVTLESGSEGIQSASGTSLDGDGDGEPGGDFTGTFEVATRQAATRVLTLPSFARAPGQSLAAPASADGLTIRLNQGEGVQKIDLSVQYDPALLNVSAASAGAGLPSSWSVNADLSRAGVAQISLSGGSALSTGSARVLSLDASVPKDAAVGETAEVAVENVSVNRGAIDARGGSATQTVVGLGDVSADGEYDGLDASLIARSAVGMQNGFDALPRANPDVVSDTDGDGRPTGADASRVARKAVGRSVPTLPDLPDAARPSERPGGPGASGGDGGSGTGAAARVDGGVIASAASTSEPELLVRDAEVGPDRDGTDDAFALELEEDDESPIPGF